MAGSRLANRKTRGKLSENQRLKSDRASSTTSQPYCLWPGLTARNSIAIVVSILIIVTIATYGRTAFFGFVAWDDDLHIYNNPYFQNHDIRDIAHFWTHPYEELYVPLSYTAFGLLVLAAYRPQAAYSTGLDGALDPHVFHIANLIAHLTNVALVFFLLSRLTKQDMPALIGALVFDVHPLQVESVAWISELRGLLATAFSLASIHLYLNFVQLKLDSKPWRFQSVYAASLLLALCAILSKPSTAILGFAIAAIGYWGCGRPWKTALYEGLPYFAPGAILAAVTAHVQHQPIGQAAPIWQRPFVAGDALFFYMWKLAAPIGLAIDYGRKPTWVLSHWWGYATWTVPAAFAVLTIELRRRLPFLAFRAAVALAAFLPVLGFAPFVFQSYSTTADRYAYFPLLGVALSVACGLAAIPAAKRQLAYGISALCLAALSLLSFNQTSVWKNVESLYVHALAVNPRSDTCYNNLGCLSEQRGNLALAEKQYRAAVELDPDLPVYCDNLARVYAEQDDDGAAEALLRGVVSTSPDDEQAHALLGRLLMNENRSQEGVSELQTAIKLDPRDYVAGGQLGGYYAQSGDFGSAAATFAGCVAARPQDETLWRNLGMALYSDNHPSDAAKALETALNLNPQDQMAKQMLQSIARQ